MSRQGKNGQQQQQQQARRARQTQTQTRRARVLSVMGTAVMAALATSSSADAAQHIYSPAGGTDAWSSPAANWSSAPASGVDTQLTFVGDNATVLPDGQVTTTTNDLGNFQLNILDLQGTGPVTTDASITIAGNTLELVASGAAALPVINLNALDGAQDLDYVITAPLALSANTTVTGNGTSAFNVSGGISGAGALLKSGTSTIVLSGANSYTGGTTINAGVIRATGAAALAGYNAPGQVTVNNGGTLSVAAGGTGEWTDLELDALRANATFNAGSNLGINVESGNTFSYASSITGPLGLSKTSGGTLVLGGTNTYTGTTTVAGGTLESASAVNLPGYNAPGRVAVAGASLRLAAGTGAWTSPELDALVGNATFGAGSNLTLDVSDAATISANITHPLSLTKAGTGTLTLSGANSYSGTTSLQNGTIAITNGAELGSGTLNLGNAANPVTLAVNGAAATIANPTVLVDGNGTGPITVNGAGPIEFTGNFKTTEANAVLNVNNSGLTTLSGPIHTTDNASTRNLRIGGSGNVLISGVISNGTAGATTGGIGYTGTGKLTLSGTNTFAGTTFVTNGTVSISSGANLGASRIQFGEGSSTMTPTLEVTGAGPVTIGNGILVRSGTAFPGILSAARPIDFTGTMTATTGTALLLINNASPTTFSGSVAISDGASNRTLRLAGTGDVLISGAVTNAVSGGSGVGSLGQFGTGTLTLSNANTYTGTTTVASGTLAIGNDAALGTGTLALGNNTAVATVIASGGPRTIANNVTLNTSAPNPATIGGSQNLTINGALTNNNSHGYLAVNNTAATTVAGNVFLSNSVANSRTLHVTGTGDARITGAISDANGAGLPGSLEYNGTGTLTVSGPLNYTGTTAATSGRLVLDNSLTKSAAVNVSGDGTIALASNGSANRAIRTPAVSIGANARIDLQDNKLVTETPAGTFTAGAYTGIQGEVARAYNFGAWDQPGLTTSEEHAGQNAGTLSGTTTIGVATAEQVLFIGPTDTGVFQGQTVTGATTIAMYTYAGDLNFDGLVDGADYGVIDNSAQFPGTDGYVNGDFNYDGIIDGADYGIIDNTIQLQGAPFPGVVFGAGASAAAASLSGVTAVPEPASLGVVGIAAAALFGRRRRRPATQ